MPIIKIFHSFAAHLASLKTSGSSSRATSGIRVSDSGSLDTVIEARPVTDKGLRASGTIIEARPVDDEGLDTVIEAQPVIEEENDVKINDTFAATQVRVFIESKTSLRFSLSKHASSLSDLGMDHNIKVEGEGWESARNE